MKKSLILLFVLLCAVPLVTASLTQLNAQTKVEICDNKADDDDDKLVDCEDPDCKCEPPKGTPCSPGYWKNHRSAFDQWCGQVSGWNCDQLWTAVNCKGRNSDCRRSEAAAALNEVSDCTED
jgi:hypothetical protein